MAINLIQIGNRIKNARKHRGLSQFDLADKIDKSPVYISYIETGIRSMSLDTFVDIANALQMTADELLQDNLENNIRVSNHEIASLLSDCTDYEKRVICETAKAVKKSIRDNRYLLYRNKR